MQDEIRQILDELPQRIGWTAYVLLFGGNSLFPDKNIKNVEFQFVGDEKQGVDYELISTQIATTTDALAKFGYSNYREVIGKFTRIGIGDADGKRSFLTGLIIADPQPRALRVCLTGDGDDDCEVLLITGDRELKEVATGNKWHEWEIW